MKYVSSGPQREFRQMTLLNHSKTIQRVVYDVLEYPNTDEGPTHVRLVKACLDPTNALPVYFAVDLSRLPPVDAEHCDVTAILMELQSLRAEVREFGHLRQEVEELKAELAKVKDGKTSSPSVVSVDHIASAAAGTATGESAVGNDRQMGPVRMCKWLKSCSVWV